jgi:hypothetical protein
MRDLGLAVSGAKVGMVSSQHEEYPAKNIIDRYLAICSQEYHKTGT